MGLATSHRQAFYLREKPVSTGDLVSALSAPTSVPLCQARAPLRPFVEKMCQYPAVGVKEMTILSSEL